MSTPNPKLIVVPRGEHSGLGPSSSKRWINCPGSVLASRDAKDSESRYAAEGTAAHYLSELCRKQGKPCIAWLDYQIQADGYTFPVDEEMCASAQEFVDWCDELPGVPLTEQRIDYSEYMPKSTVKEFGPTFGTLDDARLNDDVVGITDFKHGKGVQEFAKENTQLLLQALGVWAEFSYLYDIKGFMLRICQPRLDHKDEWYISTEDLLEWAKRLPGYAQAVELGIDFKAGGHCKFCRIRRTCAVRANSAIQIMLEDGEFENLDAQELEVAALREQNAMHFITPERLARILPSLDIFKAWIKDAERQAIGWLIAQTAVGDYKLVEGRSNRKILDEATWVGKLKALNVDPYQPRKVISVAVAEAAVGKKNFPTLFTKDKDWSKPKGKPKLAPGNDKRPAMTALVSEEFANLDEEDRDD